MGGCPGHCHGDSPDILFVLRVGVLYDRFGFDDSTQFSLSVMVRLVIGRTGWSTVMTRFLLLNICEGQRLAITLMG